MTSKTELELSIFSNPNVSFLNLQIYYLHFLWKKPFLSKHKSYQLVSYSVCHIYNGSQNIILWSTLLVHHYHNLGGVGMSACHNSVSCHTFYKNSIHLFGLPDHSIFSHDEMSQTSCSNTQDLFSLLWQLGKLVAVSYFSHYLR